MSIKVYPDRIEFGDYTLRSTDQGIEFDGEVEALDAIPGLSYGYTSGGYVPPHTTTIDKFVFSADSDATDVGDLSQSRKEVTGQSSADNGYSSGGWNGNPPSGLATIDKFPFSADFITATSVGNLSVARYRPAGQSSREYGYNSGGRDGSATAYIDTIDKFPFSADFQTATSVGILTQLRDQSAGQSSATHGYTSGGRTPGTPPYVDTIDKFPFASDGNASDVGNLTQARNTVAGQSSYTHGYTSGGFTPNITDTIDKFPFESDANATDVGNLTVSKSRVTGQSSATHGYVSGGAESIAITSVIERFPFASDASSTTVGNLTQSRHGAAGQQG